jgi:hypothetical protein
MTTLLTESGEFDATEAEVAGDALWLSAGDAEAAAGWVAKTEGLCRGEVCVPLPAGREREFVRGSRVNVAALWRHLGRPVAHSERGHVWALGGSARDRAATLRSLDAPDFTLPDASGRPHSLSDYRGKKVFLVTWASW